MLRFLWHLCVDNQIYHRRVDLQYSIGCLLVAKESEKIGDAKRVEARMELSA